VRVFFGWCRDDGDDEVSSSLRPERRILLSS